MGLPNQSDTMLITNVQSLPEDFWYQYPYLLVSVTVGNFIGSIGMIQYPGIGVGITQI